MGADHTRRAMLSAALAGPLVVACAPSPAVAAQGATEALWQGIKRHASAVDADGLLAVRRARLAGMDPNAYSGVYTSGRGYEPTRTILIFGDWHVRGAEVFFVSAEAVECREPPEG